MKSYLQQFFRKDFDWNNRIVKQEDIEVDGKKYFVSTVDLGIDHNFINGNKPLYYETMIFEGKSNVLYCDRYSTRDEAIKEHEKVMQEMKNGNLKILQEQ